jgi:hypothetical protein
MQPRAHAHGRPSFSSIPPHRQSAVFGLHGDGWTGTDSSGKAPPHHGAEARVAVGRGRSVHEVADENVVDELDVIVGGFWELHLYRFKRTLNDARPVFILDAEPVGFNVPP